MTLRVLWLIELDHRSQMRHGGNLRWFNLSRELLRRGHQVHFAINRHPPDELAGRRGYLEELRQQRMISGFVELGYTVPPSLGRAVNALTHPSLIQRCLRRRRTPVVAALQSFVREHEIDACLVSDRALLFAVPPLMRDLPVIIDWVDSFVLHGARSPFLRDPRRPAALFRTARDLMANLAQERYYTRRSSRSLVVSPVDKRCLDAIAGVPDKTRVLLNGIDVPAAPPAVLKEPGRLIFTGNMNFPPNYEAAIWFIDKVLPLVAQRRPDARFVVAGRNPTPELARASGHARRGARRGGRHEHGDRPQRPLRGAARLGRRVQEQGARGDRQRHLPDRHPDGRGVPAGRHPGEAATVAQRPRIWRGTYYACLRTRPGTTRSCRRCSGSLGMSLRGAGGPASCSTSSSPL